MRQTPSDSESGVGDNKMVRVLVCVREIRWDRQELIINNLAVDSSGNSSSCTPCFKKKHPLILLAI